MVRRILISAMVAIVFVSVFIAPAKAQSAQDDQNALKQALYNLDMSIDYLRKGDSSGATSNLNGALAKYNELIENKNVDNALDNRIKTSFSSLIQTPVEDNIRALRADVVLAASALGVSLSPMLTQSILFILLVSILFALIATLISKRVMFWTEKKRMQKRVSDWEEALTDAQRRNDMETVHKLQREQKEIIELKEKINMASSKPEIIWGEIKRRKKRISDWQKALMDAQRKKDMKAVHKLQQEQKEIMGLQGQMMMDSFKPAIFTMIPYFILWWALSGVYSNWVVAWLPFNLPMPIIGTMASLSFLSWFILAYFGFSSIWRRLLIGD